MSSKTETAEALFARRIERSADHLRMVLARREVVARARASVMPVVEPANQLAPALP